MLATPVELMPIVTRAKTGWVTTGLSVPALGGSQGTHWYDVTEESVPQTMTVTTVRVAMVISARKCVTTMASRSAAPMPNVTSVDTGLCARAPEDMKAILSTPAGDASLHL